MSIVVYDTEKQQFKLMECYGYELFKRVFCHCGADDLPELQEVQEDQASPGVFQVEAGVSHQEGPGEAWGSGVDVASSPHTNTNWLAELANIATSPQSPLLQNAPHNR